MDTPRIALLTRPGCHLCDNARVVVTRVAESEGVEWTELSIDDSAAMLELYGEQIPVVFVDGSVHDYWRVDEARLRAALTGR